MLVRPGSYLYSYPITRDFGFAPNPFHGLCTLATCKPDVRKVAKVGDWVMGVGGRDLGDVYRKCIFIMLVSEKISFQEYWCDGKYSLKKPSRNGSRVQMVGDNIYYHDRTGSFIQEDSHHSNPDGSTNFENLQRDTGRCDQVLISNNFFYFGREAINVDLDSIGHGRIRNLKKTNLTRSLEGKVLVENLVSENKVHQNLVLSDPCQFMDSHKRVDQLSGKLS